MRIEERGLSIEELARQADVPVRTIRYYITEGLLPGPGSRGKNAVYSEEHLLRLLLIRRLTEQHVPLVEIRSRVAVLSLSDIRDLLKREGRRAAEQQRVAKAESPKDYVSSLLRSARSRRLGEEPEQFAEPLLAAPPPPAAPAEQAGLFARLRTGAEQLHRHYESQPHPETLLRFELAPGVNLEVRQEDYERQRDLVEQLIDTARRHRERGLKK